jgi:peptide-methionine (S)-S-oxide reductase
LPYYTPEQQQTAALLIAELDQAGVWGSSIVTELLPAQRFFVAESCHQQYFRRNPEQSYCQLVISPKLAKFRQHFAGRLKANR